METVALCPACGQSNDLEDTYCSRCRVPMERADRVSLSEAEMRRRRWQAAARRRRVIRWGLAIAVALAIGGWVFWSLGPGSRPPVPTSAVSSAPTTEADWPMFGRDPSHWALTSGPDAVPEGRIVWQLKTGAPFESSPAVVDGTVYVSTGDRRLMALNAESGEVIWEIDVGGPVASSPAVAGGLLYVGLRDGRIIAVSVEDGTQAWEFLTGGYIIASPTVSEGIVYIGSSDKRLYALDALTGEEFWSYKAEGRLQASAAVSDKVIGIVSQGRAAQVLDAVSGRHRLDLNVAGESIAPPALDDDLLYAVDNRGAVVAIDWRQKEVPFEKTARWVRTQIYIWQFVGSLPPPKGYVWNFRAGRMRFQSAPALGHDRLFVVSDTGVLFALSRSDGSLAWRSQLDNGVSGSPSIAGDTVYVGDKGGIIYGFDALSGEERWRFEVDDEIVSTPVFAGGTMYVTAENGVLYAIR